MNVYLARQPIYSIDKTPSAFELLYREIKDDFDDAVRAGYELFQGYYFSRPVVLKTKRKDIGSTSYFRLIQELSAEELDYRKLADIIYTDAHLTYHLLKKMRKLQYYRTHTIHSVEMALVHIGENEIRRWSTLLLMRKMLGDGMDDLIRTGLIRAVFCECMAKNFLGDFSEAAFGMGMFSIISKEDNDFGGILESLQFSNILLDDPPGGSQLGDLLTLAELYEAGRWDELKALLIEKFPQSGLHNLSAMYIAAVNYADSILSSE